MLLRRAAPLLRRATRGVTRPQRACASTMDTRPPARNKPRAAQHRPSSVEARLEGGEELHVTLPGVEIDESEGL